MAYRDLPPTDCRACQQAEMSKVERLIEQLRLLAVGEPFSAVLSRSHGLFVAFAGGRTWYDRHRAVFEETGSMTELNRMLRHQADILRKVAA